MKKLDVFLVRYIPIFMLVYISINIFYAWKGIVFTDIDFLFANSFIYSLVLFFVSLADKKYHCVWNRAMYVEMMLVPAINYADSKFTIFPTAEGLLTALSVTVVLTIAVTIYLAIRHFVRASRKRRFSHGG